MTAPAKQIASIFFLTLALTSSVLACTTLSYVPASIASTKNNQFQPRAKWAVLIGVTDPLESSFGSRRSAERNVALLAQCLTNSAFEKFAPDHVLSLTGERATKASIEAAVTDKWLCQKALPNDLIVLYLCGEVLPSSDHADAVFCAYDSDSAHPTTSGVPLKRLLDDLRRRTQCKEIICFLDTSPTAVPSMRSELLGCDLTKVEHIAQDCRVSVLSASQLFQVSHDDNVSGCSSFCHYLVDGIKSGDGQWTLRAVADYVIQSIRRDSEKVHRSQLPLFALAKDEETLPLLSLGCTTKVGSIKPVNFGYPLSSLAWTRPDLLAQLGTDDHGGAASETDSSSPIQQYMALLRKSIQSNWHPPDNLLSAYAAGSGAAALRTAQSGEGVRIIAAFTLMHDGTIAAARVIESSGSSELDSSALEALRAASPFPPLPDAEPESLQVRYKFDRPAR